MTLRLIFGSDHAGFHLKTALIAWAAAKGYEVEDLGCKDENSVHYPEYGRKVAKEIASGRAEKGVLICGTGIGMSITANRFHGVRAALCHDVKTAQLSREHNNANILVLGARVLSESTAIEMLKAWLDTPFAGGRHQERLEMLDRPTES